MRESNEDCSNMRLSRRRVEAAYNKLEESIEKKAKLAINAAKELSFRLT